MKANKQLFQIIKSTKRTLTYIDENMPPKHDCFFHNLHTVNCPDHFSQKLSPHRQPIHSKAVVQKQCVQILS